MSLREAEDEREAAQGPLREAIGFGIELIQYLEEEKELEAAISGRGETELEIPESRTPGIPIPGQGELRIGIRNATEWNGRLRLTESLKDTLESLTEAPGCKEPPESLMETEMSDE